MDEELIQEYIRRFDQAFSLMKKDRNSCRWHIELTEENLRRDQQEFADRMLQKGSDDSEVFSAGVFIFYGYRLGAIRLNGKNECCTRQNGYKDSAVRAYNLDEILNEETEEDNSDVGASHILEWIIKPGSNIDISEAVLGKMIVPMVKELCRSASPGKRPECTIVIPPISKEIEIHDWTSLFSGVRVKDLQIKLTNYGHLLNLNNAERQYIFQHQTDGQKEYVIVSAYEVIRGHNTCVGSMAFDVADSDCQYILQDIKPVSLIIDNRQEQYDKKGIIEIANDWAYIECKYPVSNGFYSFLGDNEASFGREIYKLSGKEDETYDISAIKAVFHGNEALQVIDVCTRLFGEQNLYNISLGDLVYIANIMKRNKGFKKVSVETKKNFKLGTYKQFASSVDINKLYSIPSNYATFSWKIKDRRRNLVPYFSLDTKRHNEKQIIESIVNYFGHCTTDIVAEELLYLYKNGEDPSAFFVAKVFMYLSQMESLEIESRNEIVTSIENVDDVEYPEIDKSHIKISRTIKKSEYPAKTPLKSRKSTIFKQDIPSAINARSIEDIGFTKRTYNSLMRARINTVGELIKKSEIELMKVRNLGRNGVNEVENKLHELGLNLSGR